MIECKKCNKKLDENDFAKSYLKRCICKKCISKYQKEWRNINREYNRERKIIYSKNNPKKKLERDNRYTKNNYYKYLSRRKFKLFIENGKIKRPTKCDMCGCTCKPDGHHPDYSKPLNVLWLCKDCHLKAHNNRFAA